MSGAPLLSCRGLHAGYGASEVLFGIDLDVHAGEAVTLLGRNGMGKSTLLKTLVGLLPARSGEVRFLGASSNGQPVDSIARQGIAIVPEGRRVFANLTVLEHLTAFAARRGGPTWSLERLLALFPRLEQRAHHLGNQLSGGEQQMLAIARALSTGPRLLILDEATEGLAPVIRDEIWRCLRSLRQEGQTILVVDKYVDALLGLADRHLIVERGRIVWSGNSASLAAQRELWPRYLGV
jgi:branched-chain amino acid transport system ATP-binding protein